MIYHHAIVCEELGSIENLVFKKLENKALKKGFARIQAKAVGVNFPDKLMVEGKYQLKPTTPFIPGLEAAGVILEIESHPDFSVGDRVMCQLRYGGYSEEVIAPIESLSVIPNRYSFEEGATFKVAAQTAYVALVERGKIEESNYLLVLGAAGGVGSAAIQLAKVSGARVIAVASSERKRAYCKRLGADFVCGYDNLKEEVLEITANKGVDLIYDPVGGDIFREALKCIKWGGQYLVIGFAEGSIPTLPMNITLIKGISILGVRAGEYFRRFPEKKGSAMDRLHQFAEQGLITPNIYRTIELRNAVTALRMLEKKEIMGRIVLV